MEDIIYRLSKLEGPLHTDSASGKQVKQLMLSPLGKTIRELLPQYRPRCRLFPSGAVILSDGSVTTCCQDAIGSNTYGNIFTTDVTSLWQKAADIAEKGLYELSACRQCIGTFGLSSLISRQQDYAARQRLVAGCPAELGLEIMSSCNYQCCIAAELHHHRATSKLNLPELFVRLAPLLPNLQKLKLFNYGEPLLNDNLCEFIRNCRSVAPALTMTLATNGMLLNTATAICLIENQLNQVIVSVHGGPGTENMLKYSRVGADYLRVLNNVADLIKLRIARRSQLPKISLRAILFNWNDSEEIMDVFRQDAKKLGLEATWGNVNTDNYHWILDGDRERRERSSSRFMPGSPALIDLIGRKEFSVREFWS
ncbi:SPASM domain-containing protein [Sporomusa sp. GT1]|uniref:SPASM domain-containing protein n=1 Tax=Sporomusa sp. GT1 TaxID=1534747 RepID=UPI00166A14AF|nr:SPASM domain-containing protein [Sporomusa sp. GT1]